MKTKFETLLETILGNQQAQSPATQNSFSLTHPDTARAMQALADAKTMADVTKVLSEPGYQKTIKGFIEAYSNR